MKKVYSRPVAQICETQVIQMMAVSLKIDNETSVNGSEALSKEDVEWDIWNND